MTGGNTPRRARSVDWLAAHGLSLEECASILASTPTPSNSPRVDEPTVTTRPEIIWALSGEAAAYHMPGAAIAIETVCREVVVDFQPDPERFPRAFTVHQSETGLPFVSCPWRGKLRDILAIAHEFGHALQLVLSGSSPMPPVTRELCACLSEHWYADLAIKRRQGEAAGLSAHIEARTYQAVIEVGPRLVTTLADPEAEYTYEWNYPLARALAQLSATQLLGGDFERLFRGALPLNALPRKFTPQSQR